MLYNNFIQDVQNTQSNQNMQQMMMMALFPIITSAVGTIFQTFLNDIRNIFYNIFSYIYYNLNKFINKHFLNVYDDVNELHIPLIEINQGYDRLTETICPEGVPMVWYLNTKTMLDNNKLKIAKIFQNNNSQTPDPLSTFVLNGAPQNNSKYNSNNKQKKSLLFIPLPESYENNLDLATEKIKSRHDIFNTNDDEFLNSQKNKKNKNSKLTELVEIEKDIYIEFQSSETPSTNKMMGKTKQNLILKSKKKSLNEMGKFYLSIKEQYEKFNSNKSGKLYVYNGAKASPKFGCYKLDTSQSFENIFLENKEYIMNDILNMADVEYYKKYGMKRKIGHLYVGPPGSGKTCFVTAMAKMTNRSVVYIPISRIQHNAELQEIIYERNFNGIEYDMDEVIFIADELDSLNSDLLKKSTEENNKQIEIKISNGTENSNENNSDTEKNKNKMQFDNDFDKLNIGMVLNVLDGNNDQDGMILIGTANNYDKLDPAIYRNGRMELIHFNYMGRKEISNMIEFYYEVKLTPDQYQKIRDDKTVQSLNIKNMCLRYIQKKIQKNITIDKLIDDINYMFDHVNDVNEKKIQPYPKINNKQMDNPNGKLFTSNQGNALDNVMDLLNI